MKVIYYNTKDRWGDYWKELKKDSSELDQKSYPLFPAINYLKNDGVILEAGCGLGRLAKWLERNKFKVVAMELEEYSIVKLKKDSPAMECVRGDACRLPFKDNSFRYVFMMGVIDGFLDGSQRELSLAQIKRILDKQGITFISVPQADSLLWFLYSLRRNNFLRKMFGKLPIEQHIGQFAFTIGEINLLMQKYFRNFKINYANSRLGYFYIFPFFRSGKLKGVSFPELQKRERNSGENVYELNMMGRLLFPFIMKIMGRFISPTLYIIIKNE